MVERREKDGRPARSKKPRPMAQARPRPDGSVVYRRQPVDPTTGRRVSVVADSLEELAARCARITSARRDIRAGVVTIEQASAEVRRARAAATGYPLAEAWKRHAASSAVGAAYRGKLLGLWETHGANSAVAALCVHELSEVVVQGWIDGRPLSARSRVNLWNVLRAVVGTAVQSGKVSAMPWGPRWKPAMPRETKVERGALGTREDETRFLLAARALSAERAARYGLRDDLHHRVAIMIHLALRRGEAAALSWRHVEPLDGGDLLVTIEAQAREGWRSRVKGPHGEPRDPTKTDDVRRIRVSRDGLVGRALRACLALATDAGQAEAWRPVMPDRTGRHHSRDVVPSHLMREIARRAGLDRPGRHWVQHSARHSGVTRELAEGVALKDVQAITGHRSVQTIVGYMHRVGAGLPASRADLALPDMVEPERSPELAPLLLPPSGHEIQRERIDAAHERYLGRAVHSLAQYLPARGEPWPVKRPKQVTEEARKAYLRGYAKAKRAGKGPQDCARAGKYAQRAMLGAWGRLVSAERKLRGEAPIGLLKASSLPASERVERFEGGADPDVEGHAVLEQKRLCSATG